MKILSIAGRNLSSLRVEFKVDFTSGALKDCGIFAITGPTGAGKTTLLDAITLALYGRTPRSATDEDIISYGSGEAWAEVVFQTSEGRYKSEWKVRRARSKHDGALQQSTMEVSSYPDGKILTQKKREAQDKVKDLIKLEYDQFLKSVLLAQGAFKAFLDAREGERGELLEKISDTSLYTLLSKKAFERKRSEERVLDILQAALGNVVLLSEEERANCEKSLRELQESEYNQQMECTALQTKYNWLQSIEDLIKKHQEAANEVLLATQQLESDQPNLQRWESHLEVVGLEPEWLQYLHKLRECVAQRETIEKLQARLMLLIKESELAEATLTRAQNLAEDAVKLREEKMPGILEAITRTRDLLSIRKELGAIQEKRNAKVREEAVCQTKILHNEETLTKNKKKLEDLKVWLSQHGHYAPAGTSFTQATLVVSQLKRNIEDIEGYQTAILMGEKQISLAKDLQQKSLSNEIDALKELQLNQESYDNTLQRFRQLKSQIIFQLQETGLRQEDTILQIEKQQSELSRQKFLADHLSRLHEGEPCPLCGSAEHPNQTISVVELDAAINLISTNIKKLQVILKTNAQRQKVLEKLVGNLDDFDELMGIEPESPEQDLDSVFDELMQLWKILPKKKQEASQKLASAKQSQESLAENITHFETEKARSTEKLQQAQDTMAENVKRLQEISDQYFTKFDPLKPENLPTTLRMYSGEYEEKRKDESILQVIIPGTEAAMEGLKEQIIGIKQELLQIQAEIEFKNSINQQYENQIKEAHKGYVTPEAARDKLNKDEKDANEQVKKASDSLNAILQVSGKILGEKNSATMACRELEGSIKKSKITLEAGLESLGWAADLNLIREKLIRGNDRGVLEKLYKTLQEKLVLSLAHFDTCKKQLDHHLSMEMTNEDIGTIDEKLKKIQVNIREINQELGQMRRILTEDDEKNARLKEVRIKMDMQKVILNKWTSLSDLIGSADGKKFNQFAQGMTLDRLILLANHHLQLLNDRYLLKRNTIEQGLRLLIIDLYQAGNEREINTLSGGESFLVSLALALGLSEMTSKLTTIDSLFIDEGFGTLDSETLEVALNALRGLQIGGKTIGIISHVERLKEEIYTQVEITKGSDGFSSLKVIP